MIKWKNKNDCFGYSHLYGYVGKWRIFSISYNGIDRDENKKQILCCVLAGVKDTFYFPEVEQAKDTAEEIIKQWIAGLGING